MNDLTLDEPQLRRLLEVGRRVVQELDLDALLNEVLAAACEVTGARYAAFGVLDGDRTSLARFVTRGIDEDGRRAIGDLPRGRGILGALIDDPRSLRLERIEDHPRSYGFPPGHPPMTSFLGAPVLVRGQAWGNVYLTDKDAGPFTAADEEALELLAGWAAVAIENAHLYERVRRRRDELARVNGRLAATSAIARAVGTETDLDRVLELVVERARGIVEARAMVVLLAEGPDLRVAALAGEADRTRLGTTFPIAASTAGEVLDRGVPRRAAPDALRIDVREVGVQAPRQALLVPMTFRADPLGVLVAYDGQQDDGGFAVEDEQLLAAVAASAATAVATAKSVGEQRLREALASAEHERRRWARELHDETLQGLAGLQVRLSSALRGGDALEDAVQEVLDQVSLEIQGLRTLISELRPATLDELGLAPAIESLARDVGTASGLALDVAVDLEGAAASGGRLDGELETAIYRIVQEALTNVVKHARAERVVVQVLAEDEAIVVTVRDDGVGIDEATLAERHGFGITGIRERVQLAGGRLHLGRDEGGGTLLVAWLPILAARRPAAGHGT